ncbi:MAG: hypothetical protein ACTSSK_18510 [Candidatus Heimdallarchaeota archaeon]
MAVGRFREEYYEDPTPEEKQVFKDFLNTQGLGYEENVDVSIKIIDEVTNNNLIVVDLISLFSHHQRTLKNHWEMLFQDLKL